MLVFFLLSIFSFNNYGSAQNASFKSLKPNIILIMVDDMGAEALGSYGNIRNLTPNIDNLAKNGIQFNHCYSQPLCTPSRVKIMTGKYNYRNYYDFEYLDTAQYTFGNMLSDAGYNTCIAGKWQLNGVIHDYPNNQDVRRPNHFGFNEYCLWQVNHPRKPEDERYADPLITQNGVDLPRDKNAYGPRIFVEFIKDFIKKSSSKDAPFFVYYPMVLTHEPFVPTPNSAAWQDTARRYENKTTYFPEMVEYVDLIVGEIMDEISKNNIEENTIVIFTSDNGTETSIYSYTQSGIVQGGKGLTINTGNHVPLIFKFPDRFQYSNRINDVTDFTDIMPTLAELAGIEYSELELDGISLINSFDNESQDHTKSEGVFIHYSPRWGGFPHNRWVMNGEYKLYQDGSFYNTKKDINENKPLQVLSNSEKMLKEEFKTILEKKEEDFPFDLNNKKFYILK